MAGVVTTFEVTIIGRTREEVVSLMDELAFNIVNDLGGEPWIRVDDDVKKTHQPQLVMSDDQGFIYQGHLGMSFGGPMLDVGVRPQMDGHRVQNRVTK